MLLHAFSFFAAGIVTYLVLTLLFALVCLGLGHNTMEMLYGGFAAYLLALVAAVEGAWLVPEEIRCAFRRRSCSSS